LLRLFSFCTFATNKKKEIVILKSDFEKAFDLVEHEVIIEMFKEKGFSERWISWTRKPIHCKREVWPGDPLSPLLFVMAADPLQSIVNRAYILNLLKHPPGKDYGYDYPMLQYANDTIIILPAEALQLFTFKGLLRSFSNSTGLKVNYQKSFPGSNQSEWRQSSQFSSNYRV
jgi:hypothetical protein